MNKIILVLSLLAISTLAIPVNLDELRSLWGSWKEYHDKSYGRAEEAARFAIFVENYKKIVEFNAKNTNVKQALNQFADITGEEFKNLYSNNFLETADIRNPDPSAYGYSEIELPSSVDWRTKGAVTPIKNQGQCGSCWAFSATGSLEGLYFIDTGNLVSFSEQALVDCVSKNQGCNGGSISAALAYTASHGVPTEGDYPYNGQSESCQSDKSKPIRVNSGFEWVPFHNALALKTAVAKQPVSVSIEADQSVFQFYSSGVISSDCGSQTDHAVLVVGYDSNAFIVKNSWGASWGQSGYVMISTDGSANNEDGVCGILTGPIVPVK